jgi:hypothetical protein
MAKPKNIAPMFACRAWVNFVGTATPPTVNAFGNVSSVTRSTTGVYTITFTDPMPSVNYACLVTFDGTTTSVLTAQPLIVKSTANVIISLFRASAAADASRLAFNSPDVSVAIFI